MSLMEGRILQYSVLVNRTPDEQPFLWRRHGFNTSLVTFEPLNHSKRVTKFSLPQETITMGPKRHFSLVRSLDFTQGTKMVHYLRQIHQN